MTSNSPRLPSRGKLKLLWKGTDLKSLCDKQALACSLVLIYLLVTVGLYDGFCTLFELTDQTLPSRYRSMLRLRWNSSHFLSWLPQLELWIFTLSFVLSETNYDISACFLFSKHHSCMSGISVLLILVFCLQSICGTNRVSLNHPFESGQWVSLSLNSVVETNSQLTLVHWQHSRSCKTQNWKQLQLFQDPTDFLLKFYYLPNLLINNNYSTRQCDKCPHGHSPYNFKDTFLRDCRQVCSSLQQSGLSLNLCIGSKVVGSISQTSKDF